MLHPMALYYPKTAQQDSIVLMGHRLTDRTPVQWEHIVTQQAWRVWLNAQTALQGTIVTRRTSLNRQDSALLDIIVS